MSIDDIIIFSKSTEEHLDLILTVFPFLPRGDVSLKLKKGFFFEDLIYYLGRNVHSGTLAVSTEETMKYTDQDLLRM